jgi:hypothetical protein
MGAPWTFSRERIGRCGGHDLGPRPVSGTLRACKSPDTAA